MSDYTDVGERVIGTCVLVVVWSMASSYLHVYHIHIPHTTAFDCNPSRNIGWYIEGILPLLPFGSSPANLILTGVTDGHTETDVSVDHIATSSLPLLYKFIQGTSPDSPASDVPPPTLKVVTR